MRVDGSEHLGLPAEREVLTVRARNGCVAEKCRQGMRMLGRDDAGERPTVALVHKAAACGMGRVARVG